MIDATEHKARIFSSLATAQTQGWVDSSWRRCVIDYGLDPAQRKRPQVLTRTELRAHTEQLEPYRDIIERGLFELFSFVDPSGYEVSFCSEKGATLLHLPNSNAGAEMSLECPGSLWVEEIEGTNAVGTCLWERRAVSVFKADHFLSRYAQLSCAAVPLLSNAGKVLGVLNLSTDVETTSEETHRLAFNVLTKMADEVERRLFRHDFRDHCLIEMRLAPDRVALLAAHEEGELIAIDKHAKDFLGEGGRSIDGKSLWSFFDRDNLFFAQRDRRSATLVRSSSGLRVSSSILFPNRVAARIMQPKPEKSTAAPTSCLLREAAGQDHHMRRNVAVLERVRETALPVLLLGETGTGKDVFARAIHADGPRAKKPFVALNCTAMPETLIDSELFGYVTGAFTGAKKEGQAGRIVEANGGTLFLDEIGDMPLGLQTRLLRFLENAEVMPMGGGAVRRVDVRVIAATNVSVIQAVKEGRFRADLYYRLAGVVVNLPALRDRSDFELIASRVAAVSPQSAVVPVSPAAMSVLKAHDWPGNIRELRNVLRRAACFADGVAILPEHLIFDMEVGASQAAVNMLPQTQLRPQSPPAPDNEREGERAVILEALRVHGGDVIEAAKSLNMSRPTLYRRLKEMGVRQRGTRRIRVTAAE